MAKTRILCSETELLTLCDAYRKTMRIGELRLGQIAAGASVFFKRLRGGGTCTLRKSRETLQWFSDNWPYGVSWPEEIPRPEPSPDALARRAA